MEFLFYLTGTIFFGLYSIILPIMLHVLYRHFRIEIKRSQAQVEDMAEFFNQFLPTTNPTTQNDGNNSGNSGPLN